MKFKWKGLEKNNFAEGEIEAEEKEDAIYLLKEQGVTVTTCLLYTSPSPRDS